ncbi:hypothetical protein EDD86DRAFT_247517 [Gorgonomyces haynaldii]|nr:hypothetical protein EDD86DRAFT_247517 [Gorgonomyces haynaldii]
MNELALLAAFPIPPTHVPGVQSEVSDVSPVTPFTAMERDYNALLTRSSIQPIAPGELSSLFDHLLRLDDNDYPRLDTAVDKHILHLKPQHEFAMDVFRFVNTSNKPVHFSVQGDNVQCEPREGNLSPSESCAIQVSTREERLKTLVVVTVMPGQRHFLLINYNKPEEFKRDAIFPGSSYRVPWNLAYLRGCLFSHNGAVEPDIFRKQPDPDTVVEIQQQLSERSKITSNDHEMSYVTALSKLKPDEIASCHSEQDAWKLMEQLGSPSLFWVVDLMLALVLNEQLNNLTLKHVCQMFAPVLYSF